jgi:hypothetical protein
MTTAAEYRHNADNCAQLAAEAKEEPSCNRFKRMEAAWRALSEEQDWLDGIGSPPRPSKRTLY